MHRWTYLAGRKAGAHDFGDLEAGRGTIDSLRIPPDHVAPQDEAGYLRGWDDALRSMLLQVDWCKSPSV